MLLGHIFRKFRVTDLLDLYKNTAMALPGAAVFLVDRQYRYVLAGGDGLASVGMTPADFHGRFVADMVPSELLERALSDFDKAFSDHTFTREHQVGERYFESHGKPFPRASGQGPQYALVVSYDITERKRAELRLQLLSDIGSALRHSASADGVVSTISAVLHAHLHVRQVFFGTLSSLNEREAEKPACATGIAGDGDSAFGAAVLRIDAACAGQLGAGTSIRALSGAQATLETNLPGASASTGTLVLCPYLEHRERGALFAALREGPEARWADDELHLMGDICNLGWQWIEKHRSDEALRTANIGQQRFLAVLGHELRNPLSAIQSALELLKASSLPHHAARAHAVIGKQFKQIDRLMDDLSAISRPGTGTGLVLRREATDLVLLVDDALRAIRHVAAAKGHAVTRSLPVQPVTMLVDPVRILQIVNNLIVNAIKYTPVGGAIEVRLISSPEGVEISVSDNGIGMTADTLAEIFDMFGRGREALAQAQEGLGVGMWLARQFVLAHGGTIDAASDGAGLGSTVTVRLPHCPGEQPR